MKKIIVTILAGLALLPACKQTRQNDADRDWKAEIQEKEAAFNEWYSSISESEDVVGEQRMHMIDSTFEVLQQDMSALGEQALKYHKDDSVTLFVIKEMYNYYAINDEMFADIVRNSGPAVQSDSEVKAIMARIENVEKTAKGSHFIDFEVEQPDGRIMKLSDFAGRGKYCLVDFWASWCGPCKGEIPNLKSVYDKYAKKGLNMVSVAVCDEPQASLDTAAAYGIKWNHIVNAGTDPLDLYGISGIPHIILIGPDGTIIARDLRGDDIADTIEKYL